jgi:hypothetical protein
MPLAAEGLKPLVVIITLALDQGGRLSGLARIMMAQQAAHCLIAQGALQSHAIRNSQRAGIIQGALDDRLRQDQPSGGIRRSGCFC